MPIFVSYTHKDKDFADKLCRNLVSKRINRWMDRWELKPGDSLIDSVQNALEHSGAILLLLSNAYIESNWCKKELNASLIRELEGHGNIIIPIRLDDSEWPIFLREKFYADFRTEWDEPLRMLMESLYKYVNAEQDRFDTPEFHVDFSSEAIIHSESEFIVGYRYNFCEHAENRPFSVLSIIYVDLSDDFIEIFNDIAAKEGEDKARVFISNIMLDYFDSNKIDIELTDATPHEKYVAITNKAGLELMTLHIEVRWMGEDTGKTVLYFADQAMKGALKIYLEKIRIK
jgi:hypothetical protein